MDTLTTAAHAAQVMPTPAQLFSLWLTIVIFAVSIGIIIVEPD